MSLIGKKILIGISGGIAAYKTCELVRLFKKQQAEVRVIMTPSALNFVSPVTLSALSGNKVLINMFPDVNPSKTEKVESSTQHIYLGMWGDVFVIAPATANTIAKMVYGMADNLLTATVLSSRCPIIVSPAMDEDMYQNQITSQNITKLNESGFWIIEPETGELASGLFGTGRMPEPEVIFKYVEDFLKNYKRDLNGKKILITAGPTYEPIDDVRYIGNYSSGKMGFQLANAASQRGAEVTLISGPAAIATPRNVSRLNVKTSDEMFNAVKNNSTGKDYIIMSAAVSDYKSKEFHSGKMKKSGSGSFLIETSKTVDILEYLGKHKNGSKLIGFALETDNEIEYATEKLKQKNLDMIVVNNPKVEGAGFGTDTNVISIIDKNLNVASYEKMTKFQAANVILDKMQESALSGTER
ncbi:MAG: bifunctional phosphopantothenoylcysteine decarboxylase/phosphopantothenate--cysteine ligase CoaBC [Chlorobi bacterium]|nr:bifunctional phosphopantothenoylcysteine decarboxylase/phosphopantothenate--cysteine ligase CoaBC [Chlorobiota bacterium]